MRRESRVNERQRKILYCVVREYILTRKPISSEHVLNVSNLSCSGATVRNDLRKLEYLGYLYQPHTSAGRIPTDKGFRFYVDETLKIAKDYAQKSHQVDVRYPMTYGDMEKILEGATIALARMTKGVVILEKPDTGRLKVLRAIVTPITSDHYLVSVVTELGLIKFMPFRTFESIDHTKLEALLNHVLKGRSIENPLGGVFENDWDESLIDLSEELISSMRDDLRSSMIKVGLDVLVSSEKFNIDEIRSLSKFFSDDTSIKSFLSRVSETPAVFIGSEHGIEGMERFSVFVDSYRKADEPMGKVLIITSKVVKYEEIMNVLTYVTSRLTEYFTVVTREVER
ncbi:heat-inducible transcriptional repressor HrcA [Pseudothermotoga sp.]|nr:heat-inducible transcriptional repressor HrcA [Pseudothermotoga sp.]MCX7812727.1 heat-inducible transcriptional repressor HrcA [Pseudothermotoga sp.]MDW8139007.1 heat-inducible transcriptional repressor HrcA [Pseudothermotoga sp.]